ncbi:uncharacterized protein LOC122070272 isoform X3 [Macadamia integrifolia]|uniref:uncharacterized protein LOC122070272 isoform X3 n=1 Tax=Macadamia integrifolia TaxID=60698 RepID=UPI001C4FFB4C|nr:uncharacterized protein LOC122070272 isoform X3 [Macadamia integrifolia]
MEIVSTHEASSNLFFWLSKAGNNSICEYITGLVSSLIVWELWKERNSVRHGEGSHIARSIIVKLLELYAVKSTMVDAGKKTQDGKTYSACIEDHSKGCKCPPGFKDVDESAKKSLPANVLSANASTPGVVMSAAAVAMHCICESMIHLIYPSIQVKRV